MMEKTYLVTTCNMQVTLLKCQLPYLRLPSFTKHVFSVLIKKRKLPEFESLGRFQMDKIKACSWSTTLHV